jgi:hypothetical protein
MRVAAINPLTVISRATRIAILIVVAALASLPVFSPAASASGSAVPFTDPSAHGYIGLCDLAGNNVTSGSVTSAPFVWKAVSSVDAPAGYFGKGQNVALTIYQPRKGVDPGDWNGDQLTGASYYRKNNLPAAAATYKDISLETIVKEYPPEWDGLYQLRMIFARNNYGDSTATYPATVIQVTGKTWHVVQGGTAPCKTSHTISNETFSGIPVTDPHPDRSGTPTSAPSSARASSTPRGTGHAKPGTLTSPPGTVITSALSDGTASSSSSSDAPAIVLGSVAVVVLAVLGGGLWYRRRSGSAATP